MTSTNTGPQAIIPNEIPHEVWLNWRESYTAAARADDIESVLPTLDERIAKAQADLDFLKSEHKRAGRDITEHRRRAETYREMVELWCSKHGRQLPPELTLADLQPAPPVQQALPAPAIERDAGVEPLLGLGVAGETTTQTIADAVGGGDADPLGDFHPQPPAEPGNGRNGGGEGRA